MRIDSIAQIHQMIGRPPLAHPHLAVIAASWQPPLKLAALPVIGVAIESGLYVVSLKRGDECRAEFGRQGYDGQAGTIVFLSPGQTMTPLMGAGELVHEESWTLAFHPDLLKGSALAEVMHRYRFFGYAAREGLHVEEAERERLTSLVRQLEQEAASPPDSFAQDIITAQLQVLLSSCQRAYSRQFETRVQTEGLVARRLDRFLEAQLADKKGLPTVSACARALGYSADYLSDLLRAETGLTTRQLIHRTLIEAAKARLLSATASEVAYALGFEHPQHFARLFRQKTGEAPGAWRRRELTRPSPQPSPKGPKGRGSS